MLLGMKLLVMKYLGNVINQIIMTLAIFIKEFFSTLKIVECLKMEKKVDGMLSMKMKMV